MGHCLFGPGLDPSESVAQIPLKSWCTMKRFTRRSGPSPSGRTVVFEHDGHVQLLESVLITTLSIPGDPVPESPPE